MNLKNATWNFTTSGHGKSVADAIGGCVKGLCDRAVLHGNDVISASDVVKVVENSKERQTKMFVITTEDIDKIDAMVPKNLKAVPNTMKILQLLWLKDKKDFLFTNSLSCPSCLDKQCIHYSLSTNGFQFNKMKKISKVSKSKSNKKEQANEQVSNISKTEKQKQSIVLKKVSTKGKQKNDNSLNLRKSLNKQAVAKTDTAKTRDKEKKSSRASRRKKK